MYPLMKIGCVKQQHTKFIWGVYREFQIVVSILKATCTQNVAGNTFKIISSLKDVMSRLMSRLIPFWQMLTIPVLLRNFVWWHSKSVLDWIPHGQTAILVCNEQKEFWLWSQVVARCIGLYTCLHDESSTSVIIAILRFCDLVAVG